MIGCQMFYVLAILFVSTSVVTAGYRVPYYGAAQTYYYPGNTQTFSASGLNPTVVQLQLATLKLPLQSQVEDHRPIVLNLLDSFQTNDPRPRAFISRSKYINHNLDTADGFNGFLELVSGLVAGENLVGVVRIFQDNEYVFAHVNNTLALDGSPTAAFEIFRFENGLIVEHWDNFQTPNNVPNPSGHTMYDGPAHATDLDKTDANKALVRDYMQSVVIDRQAERLPSFFRGQEYIQHDPDVADGTAALTTFLGTSPSEFSYSRIHLVLGEGNFVLTLCDGIQANQPIALYDLFRVENGKIAEHWETKELIPPRSEWKNNNGKF